ncbi:desmoglein-2 [Hemicordylus capensis]|uniref:desmoglein-2 n=1 Tax=Hemicordylus capensis TaxID=884348 RepID=UPI0023032190|nr:desmoglein-2 [Hemicordylus capensis]
MAGLEIVLLLSCVIFGSGLHVEVRGGRNDQLFNSGSLIRQKREWIVPSAGIWEERDNSGKNPIAKIRSDREVENGVVIRYSVTGEGITAPPFGLFVIDEKTGELNVTSMIVDREQTPLFRLTGFARNQNGENMEKPLELIIKVKDINDNFPVFSEEVFVGSVEELCTLGTLVIKLNAIDNDEPNTLNSKIAYRIISQDSGSGSDSGSAFIISKATGEVRTATFQLDREVQSSYSLTVEAKDQDGGPNGLGKQTTLQIKILDVNDNIPTLEKSVYEGSVKENTANVDIMRIKVFDRDEKFSDNWLANFTIVSGNEGGYFRIETDSKTNEGILTLVKEINYEELQNIDLNIVVANKAAYHSSIISQGYQAKPIPVKIKVENVKEGPVFKPQILVVKASETMKVGQIIGSFQAYDEDTGKIAEHLRYAKDHDAGNWITIDSKTAEIKLLRVPDYESSFVVNGTYTATILAITDDFPSKTATGTIAIQVVDVNDNCPTIVTPDMHVCTDVEFVNFTVEDRDAHPNGGPFTVTVINEPERMSDKWVVERVDGSTVWLTPKDLKPGQYEIPMLVKDNQGFSCPKQQHLTVTACDCAGGGCFSKRVGSYAALGPAAIALMILALLLLLLVPLLLLACRFGSAGAKGFATIPEHSEEMLRNWNSEGAAPEDKAMLNLIAPSALDHSASNLRNGAAGAGAGIGSSSTIKDHYNNFKTEHRWEQQALLSEANHRVMGDGSAMAAGGRAGSMLAAGAGSMTMGARETMAMGTGGAVNEEFLRSYFSEKADAFADEEEAHLAKDCLLVYSQEEEKESLHDSIGCCSFIEGDFDDHFLDDLGDKFKTLAEICTGKHISLEARLLSNQAPQGRSPSPAVNGSDGPYLHQQNALSSEHTYTSGSSYHLPEPVRGFGSETVTEVTETSLLSRPGLQQVRPIPDPGFSSNVIVTETSYGAIPSTVILDPQFKENVVVTERVLAPASNLQEMLDMPTGVFPDLPDSNYVVVRERERVLVPSSDLKASLSTTSLSEGLSGSDRQEHIFISDPLFNQAETQQVPSPGSTLKKSSTVTKYSSVQYTRS